MVFTTILATELAMKLKRQAELPTTWIAQETEVAIPHLRDDYQSFVGAVSSNNST